MTGASFSDRFNPILVKDARQMTRGRFLPSLLFFLLLFVTGYFGLAILLSGEDGPGGADSLLWMMFFLNVGSFVMIPLWTGWRMWRERQSSDLIFLTTLKPRQIVLGTYLSSVLLTLMIYSTMLPFAAFTYFLKGVDLFAMLSLFGFSLVVVLNLNMLAMLLASLKVSRALQVVLAFFGLLGFLFTLSMVTGWTAFWIGSGASSFLTTAETIATVTGALLLDVLFMNLLLSLIIGLIKPVSARRSRSIRLSMATFILGLMGGALAAAMSERAAEPLIVALIVSTTLWCLGLLGSSSELERPSVRIAANIPRYPLKRLGSFLLNQGQTGGLFFYGILGMTITVACLLLGLNVNWTEHKALHEFALASAGVSQYVICYVLTGGVVYRTWLARRMAPKHTWVAVLLLGTACAVVPVLFCLLFCPGFVNHPEQYRGFFVLTPMVFDDKTVVSGFIVSLIWLFVAGFLNLERFSLQYKAYQRAEAP